MKPRRKATIDDVAELAGVSIKTVSRVTNAEPNVRQSTREKVEEAIAKLDYRPNISARSLASSRSHLLVLVYDDPSAYEVPSSGYIIRLQQGLLRTCRNMNYELLIHPCSYRDKDVGRELKGLIQRSRPDGVVLAAPLSNMAHIVQAIEETEAPCVKLSTGEVDAHEFSIGTNDQEISAEMTRYLVSLGHRRIAFITGDTRHKAVANRFLGYRDGLQQSGLDFDEELIAHGDNSIGSGEACAGQLLNKPNPPTAIFAANDDMAAGVIRVADLRGIDVPGQLSVAGCDDNSLARQIFPALTTIRQPLSQMAERAARSLVEKPEGNEAADRMEVVPGSIQVRESTGPAPK